MRVVSMYVDEITKRKEWWRAGGTSDNSQDREADLATKQKPYLSHWYDNDGGESFCRSLAQ